MGEEMKYFLLKLLLIFFSYTSLSFAATAKLPGNIALHIAKTHYLHPVRLLHPYLEHWHMKGPLAEKAAIDALQTRFAHVQECEQGDQANVVLLLEPHMFYNAQLRVFHAEYIARAYTSDGEPITRIKQEAMQIGELAIAPDFFMEQSYSKAIDKVIAALETEPAFLALLESSTQVNAGDICKSLDLQPLEKLYY